MYAHRCRGRNRSLWGTVDTRLSPGVIAPCGWRTHLNYAAKCRAQNGQPTLGLNEAEQRSEHGLSSAPPHLILALDRKSTRLNSSHPSISYAVFCLKKKTTQPLNEREPADTLRSIVQ